MWKLQANTGTSPAGEGSGTATWTDVLFGTAGYELRFCGALAGGTTTASASWPPYTRPTSGSAVIPEGWAFSADTTGLKVTNYDGTSAHYLQYRINWDNTGTFASAPIISAWKDNTYPAATPGSQPGSGDGSAIVNGSSDTSNTSYLKCNAYGQGLTSGGSQQTPASNAGGTLTVTSGTAGAATPSSASWLATFQSLQSSTQYLQNGGVPQSATSGLWYFLLALYTSVSMVGGTLVPVIGVQYTWV